MPLAVSPLITSFFGAKVDGISSMQVHPLDPHAVHKNSIGRNVQSSGIPERAPRTMRKMAFTVEETRHHYAIEALKKPGAFRQPYRRRLNHWVRREDERLTLGGVTCLFAIGAVTIAQSVRQFQRDSSPKSRISVG